MSPEDALASINASQKTNYSLEAQYSGGQDQGAFRISEPGGQRAVLKISRNPTWAKQIERAKAATEHLRALGYPTPTYGYVGATDRGTYWLQNVMPGGAPIGAPTMDQITHLINLIELQAGRVISEVQGQDWCWYLMDVVFRGESGNVRSLMQYSPHTSSLAADAEGLVAGMDGKVLQKNDLVHGNLGIDQVLFVGQEVSAVLDWDQVGYGDRTIDFVALWYSILESPEASAAVMNHMLKISDSETIKICSVDRILSRVAWNINMPGGDVSAAAAQARTALDQLYKI